MKISEYTIINGKPSKVICNESKAKEWNLEDANIDTLKVVDELLKFKDSSLKYPKGITVINAVDTISLVSNLNVTRPSNHIGIIRSDLPADTLITYRTPNERDTYGIVKSDESIKCVEALRERLLKVVESKDIKLSKAYEDNRTN
ncbi:hypothetical protein [Sulfurimonas xiamenensis]|uniref:Uncharacterized protein n=1 Tax=Sulfurimonas xiamenensis TaxID=2590021 RepID=A0AAJ4A1W2_9BACT|nr:hypothetical protein [Sulfurimonas xiamenensis]QFR42407.1 hypothetical protein FJR47_00105 [Sulfurimonas xiamenensis]